MYKDSGKWGGSSEFSGCKFIGYDETHQEAQGCENTQHAISTNTKSPNYHPLTEFKLTKFTNTADDAMFHFGDPNPGWINENDCGDFTCTGLYNVLVEMAGTDYNVSDGNIRSVIRKVNFQVTSQNKESDSI
jgi:hypothetical protein